MAAKRTTTKSVQATEDKPFDLPQVDAKPEIDDDEDMDSDGLNMRRRAFVEHITGKAFGNATRAAELAGYASDNVNALKVTACRLLTIANVQEAIRSRLADAKMDAESTRRAIAAYARASMADFISVEGGEPTVDWDKAAANGAIGHVKEIREEGFNQGGTVEVVKRTFKLRDPMPALALLAKMNGLVAESPAASVIVNVHQMNENDLVRIASTGGNGAAAENPGTSVPDRIR